MLRNTSMQPNPPSRFHYAFLKKALTLGVLVVSVGLAYPCIYFAEKFRLSILTAVGAIIFLGGLFVAIFVVREVVGRMEEEGSWLFGKAVAHTVNGYVLKLCFIPIIGPMIERFTMKDAKKNPFVETDDRQ